MSLLSPTHATLLYQRQPLHAISCVGGNHIACNNCIDDNSACSVLFDVCRSYDLGLFPIYILARSKPMREDVTNVTSSLIGWDLAQQRMSHVFSLAETLLSQKSYLPFTRDLICALCLAWCGGISEWNALTLDPPDPWLEHTNVLSKLLGNFW